MIIILFAISIILNLTLLYIKVLQSRRLKLAKEPYMYIEPVGTEMELKAIDLPDQDADNIHEDSESYKEELDKFSSQQRLVMSVLW